MRRSSWSLIRGAVLGIWLPLLGGIMLQAGAAAAASPPSGSPPLEPAASGQPPALTPETVTPDTIMAEVNGVKITFGELEKHVREQIPNVTGHGTISSDRLRLRSLEILEEMINDELILQEAKRLGIGLDKKRVDAEMAKQRSRFSSKEKYQDALEQRHLTEPLLRARMERGVLIQQVVNHEVNEKITVTDEEMAAYYKDHKEKFQIPMQYRLRLLLVSVDPAASPDDWEQARKRALDFKSRGLKSEDFAALARQYSGDDGTKKQGGDTGLIHHGQLGLVDVEDAVEPLKPGDITDPVRTIYGFYLARVEEKRPGRQQTFDEVNKKLFRQELAESKREQQYREWFTALKTQAKIARYATVPAVP